MERLSHDRESDWALGGMKWLERRTSVPCAEIKAWQYHEGVTSEVRPYYTMYAEV